MTKEPSAPKSGGHSHGGGGMGGMDMPKTSSSQVWETLSGMSRCDEPVKISKGDVLTLQSYYDLERHPAREFAAGGGMAEEMGLMLFSLARKNSAS
jgi:hypothetical protein